MAQLQNAQITSASVRLNDRDILEFSVCVDFEKFGSGKVEGHWALYLPPSFTHHNPMSLLGHVIWHWLRVTDSQNIGEMVGKIIRVETESLMSTVPIRVGHPIKDDRWFSTGDIVNAHEECN